MRYLILLKVLFISTLTYAQHKTNTGLEYTFHRSNDGSKPINGDYALIHVILKTDTDSLISSTYEEGSGEPVIIPVSESMFVGDPMEAIKLMSEGDSATFLISADSMAQGMELLPNIRKGSKVSFMIKLLEILSPHEYSEQMKERQIVALEKSKEIIAAQTVEIENYLRENNIEAEKTSTGLYYVIEEKGDGKTPETGNYLNVDYKGYLMDGEIFDSSYDRGEPIEFSIGVGHVIPGWDEGIMLFNEGGKGKLLIPSPLAYGDRQAGSIPPNSILIFDIELHKVVSDSE